MCNEIKVELSRDGAKGKDGSIRDKGQGSEFWSRLPSPCLKGQRLSSVFILSLLSSNCAEHRSTASRGAAASDASKDISIMDKLVAQLQQGQEGMRCHEKSFNAERRIK